MVNWHKRVTSFSENGLADGEKVLGVGFLQDPGSLTEATGRASFGLIGMLVSRKMTKGKKEQNKMQASTMSKAFPAGAVIVAVTDGAVTDGRVTHRRIMVYEQAALSGKPKKLVQTYSHGDITVRSYDKGMLKTDMTLAFKDGGLRLFELAKGQNIAEFEAALSNS